MTQIKYFVSFLFDSLERFAGIGVYWFWVQWLSLRGKAFDRQRWYLEDRNATFGDPCSFRLMNGRVLLHLLLFEWWLCCSCLKLLVSMVLVVFAFGWFSSFRIVLLWFLACNFLGLSSVGFCMFECVFDLVYCFLYLFKFTYCCYGFLWSFLLSLYILLLFSTVLSVMFASLKPFSIVGF